ncbi:MAG: putative Phosphoribulokinase/uridine kinase family [Candidatus Eremiobacteraeota bacterium]|nr:putative Phosphoribulokinase/uridine kinase family [Candidatus Eremiobacteraeota bacterium]
MVAVGGDSGTGKATLCAGLRAIFGDDRCTEVRLDGYFGLNRAQRYAVGITALDPRSHDFAAMDEGLMQLANGGTIVKPVYDHLRGAIASTETIEPRDIVLVQGLFPLYTRVLRALFDVSVWLEPDPELKLAWTIHRDTTERGYREDQVRAELERRSADYERHIAPQAEHADIRASFTPNGVTFHKSGRLPPLDYRDFESTATRLRLIDDGPGPYPRSIIEVDATIDEETTHDLEDAIWREMGQRHAATRPPQLGTYSGPGGEQRSRALALGQLLVARRIGLIADQLSGAIAV